MSHRHVIPIIFLTVVVAGCKPEAKSPAAPSASTTSPVGLKSNLVAPLAFGEPLPEGAFSDCTEGRLCRTAPLFPQAAHAHPEVDNSGRLVGLTAVFAGSYDQAEMQIEEQFGTATSKLFFPRKWKFSDPLVTWETPTARALAIELPELTDDWSPSLYGQRGVIVWVHSTADKTSYPATELAAEMRQMMVPEQHPYVRETFDIGSQNYVVEDIEFAPSELGDDGRVVVRYSVVNNTPKPAVRNATLMLETVDGLEGPSDSLTREAMGSSATALDAPIPLGLGVRLFAVFKTTRAAVGTPGTPATLVILPEDRTLSPVKMQFYDEAEVRRTLGAE